MPPPPPSKLVYVCAKGAFRKTLGSVSQKWVSQNSKKKRDPLGRQRVEFLKRGRPIQTTPPPPKSAGARVVSVFKQDAKNSAFDLKSCKKVLPCTFFFKLLDPILNQLGLQACNFQKTHCVSW